MGGRFRVPMVVVAAALLGLIALLATLQYRWLGQVSAAERERMTTNLASRAAGFAHDFDREITRAYLTFQIDPLQEGENVAGRLAERYDRWQATSRYPRLLKNVYLSSRTDGGNVKLQRYNPSTRFVEPVVWPGALQPIREHLEAAAPMPPVPSAERTRTTAVMMRAIPPTVWDSVPALVVPTPVVFVNTVTIQKPAASAPADMLLTPAMGYTILELDRDYLSGEMLPALAQQHFHATSEGTDYELAVVGTTAKTAVYTTAPSFTPDPEAPSDARADLFQVRLQEFGAMVSEVRRLTSFVSRIEIPRGSAEMRQATRQPPGTMVVRETAPLSVLLQHGAAPAGEKQALETALATAGARAAAATAKWRLVVKHPSGSLETAVASVRRRNLVVSSGILAILGVSIGFLVVSTRRAQDLARQQMEFVAAVSHELRTPLAVIRSAADNLADGVVHEDPQVRKYGSLVRGEGRRLTEMVEQILELAGIQSGQRGFALAPVAVQPLLRNVIHMSSTLVEDAGLEVEYDIPDTLPPVLGDEQGLRRVFQNLVGNAIKYGAGGGWIGIRARASGREVLVSVADRGIGIDAAEQGRIFEPFYRTPDVVAAQIHGAGLGLSLVRRIVEAHGGRITVRSAPGSGSEFTVHLPAASGEAAPQTASATDPARTSA